MVTLSILHGWTRMAVSATQSAASIVSHCLQLPLPGFFWCLLCGSHLYNPCLCGMSPHSVPMCFSSPVPAVIFKEHGLMCLYICFKMFSFARLLCMYWMRQAMWQLSLWLSSTALHKSLWSIPRTLPVQHLGAAVIDVFFLFLQGFPPSSPPLFLSLWHRMKPPHICARAFMISVQSILRKFFHSLIWKHTLSYPVRETHKQDSYWIYVTSWDLVVQHVWPVLTTPTAQGACE